MKKIILVFTAALMTLTTVAAEKITVTNKGADLNISRYNYVQPILFVERGVEFLIFPDGSFDFNTNLNYTQGETYYRTNNTRTRTRTLNTTFGAPGTTVTYATSNIPRGTIVTHDRDGKVRRVGNVFVNYNRYNQVKRLGSVYINYNRFGMVNRIGGLHIRYNRNGKIIAITGQVNRWNTNCSFCGINTCNINHFGSNPNWNDTNENTNNDNFYYYKKGDKIVKQKKLK